jgi:hypothetical protein
LVIEDGCRGRGNRGFGRAIKQGRCCKWRDVGNNALGSSGIDKALDIERLSDDLLEDIVRGVGGENIVGAAPNGEQSLI